MAPKKQAEPEPVIAKPVEEKPPVELLDGDFVFHDGATYTGQYTKQGDVVKLHGNGELQTGPETFEGIFDNGLYKNGKYTMCSGAVYNGDFRNNIFHGVGEYSWPDGRSYSGTWRDGNMHGRGQYLNFNVGADKVFEGYSVHGLFASGVREQENAKTSFMTEYGGECSHSVSAALHDMATRATAEGAPHEFFVPLHVDGETAEAANERRAVEDLVSGPFPTPHAIPQALLQGFVARLADHAEHPLQVKVLMKPSEASTFEAKRLRGPQLQLVGQAVEVLAQGAEAGHLMSVALVNVCLDQDIAHAKWKVIDCQVQT